MPIDRGPTLSHRRMPVERGRLIRLRPPEPGSTASGDNMALTFQYNPETVTFSRTGRFEPRKRRRRPDAVQTPQQTFGQQGGHGASALLSESETVSFSLVFDATETMLRPPDDGAEPDPALGVLPELSFLQLVSLGREVEEQHGASRGSGTEIRPIRPDELLLQLGNSRWYPCAMTELRVTEQRHDPRLVPVRAECALTLTVLEPVESAYNDLTRQAFQHLLSKRVEQASVVGTHSSSTLAAALGERGTP